MIATDRNLDMFTSALINRLKFYADMSDKDVAQIQNIEGTLKKYSRGADIITAGEDLSNLLIVKSGWAIRYKTFEDGRRQILNVLLPGDFFDLQVMVAAEADHSVSAVDDVEALAIKPNVVREMFTGKGTVPLAFWWTQVQEEAFLREQIVRNGRQTARERIGHFLLELHRRAQIANISSGDGFNLPLTQAMIADALGLTSIHTNRVLRQLAKDGLIEKTRSYVKFLDTDKLAKICDFDPAYFHLDAFNRRLINAG